MFLLWIYLLVSEAIGYHVRVRFSDSEMRIGGFRLGEVDIMTQCTFRRPRCALVALCFGSIENVRKQVIMFWKPKMVIGDHVRRRFLEPSYARCVCLFFVMF